MAKLTTHTNSKGDTEVIDVSPGRSIYLSNSQWGQVEVTLKQATKNKLDFVELDSFQKLLKVANEVQAKNDMNRNKEDN